LIEQHLRQGGASAKDPDLSVQCGPLNFIASPWGRPVRYFLVIGCVSLSVCSLPSQAAVNFDVVGLSGATGTTRGLGPGLGADVHFNLGSSVPVINNEGRVAFGAFLTGAGVTDSNNRGMWSNGFGPLVNLAREGPGGPGPNVESDTYFTDFGFFNISDSGAIAFGVASAAPTRPASGRTRMDRSQ
jgi:hypothetical protein